MLLTTSFSFYRLTGMPLKGVFTVFNDKTFKTVCYNYSKQTLI